jgi:hypothetical protein
MDFKAFCMHAVIRHVFSLIATLFEGEREEASSLPGLILIDKRVYCDSPILRVDAVAFAE